MRIAHISDFHARHHVAGHPQILRRRSRQMPALIAKAILEIRGKRPDVLVVTGDLVDAPFYGMNDAATIERVERDLRLLRDIIDPVGCPVLYLYGNHDQPGAFERVFPDGTPDITIEGYRFVSFYDEEVRENRSERLGDQRDRFDRVLTDSDRNPQIHLQHYMVWPENNEGYPHSYRESRDLKSRIVASGKVLLALSGHFHGGVDAFEEDGTWFSTSRAFCEPPHPYRIYDVDNRQVRQTEFTIDTPSPTQVLFLDFDLMDKVTDDTEFTKALCALREEGWFLIGVSSPGDRTPQDFEMANDVLIEQPGEVGCELDAVSCRRGAKPSGPAPYRIAGQDLGVDLETSHALVGSPKEANAARSVGIKTASTKPDRVNLALRRLLSP